MLLALLASALLAAPTARAADAGSALASTDAGRSDAALDGAVEAADDDETRGTALGDGRRVDEEMQAAFPRPSDRGLAAASAAPTAPPLPSASAAPADAAAETVDAGAAEELPPLETAVVRLKDRRVFVVHGGRNGVSAHDRASRATKALERTLEEKASEDDVRVDETAAYAVVYVGSTPIIQLGQEDADAVGDASLSVHAASVASSVRSALRGERVRSAIANTVFHVSLVVFAGLIMFLVLRRSTTLAERMQRWLEEHPERIPSLSVGGVELLGRAGLRGVTGVLLTVVVRLLQVGVLYVWVVFSLSLFEATHDLSTRTSGFVTKPVGALAGRLGTALPLLAITFVAVVAVWGLVRFLGLFFGSIARRETWVSWLPPDVAGAAGVLARTAVVVLALVFAAPLVTGSDEGALSRVGIAALGAVGLASIPILAAGAVGVIYVFGRRLRTGDVIELGPHTGRVREVTLLETRLEDGQGCEIRVPHLSSLVLSARVVGRVPVAELHVSVEATQPQGRVREVLLAAARERDPRAQVRLVRLDRHGALYRVAALAVPDGPDLAVAVAEALAREGIALGALAAGAVGEVRS